MRQTILKLIFLNRDAASRTLELGKWSVALLSACIIGVPLGLIAGSYQLGFSEGVASEQATRVSAQEQQAIDRAEALAQMGVEAQSRLTAMTRRLASLQAHVTRLDALGSHLTDLAGLEAEEFDFSGPPALGGPALMRPAGTPPGVGEVDRQFTALDAVFARREAQFDILQGCCLQSSSVQRRPLPVDPFALAGNRLPTALALIQSPENAHGTRVPILPAGRGLTSSL